MLTNDEIKRLVKDAYGKLSFISFSQSGDTGYTRTTITGNMGRRRAIKAIEKNDFESMFELLNELKVIIQYFDEEDFPEFLQKIANYKKIYDIPNHAANYGPLEDPEVLTSSYMKNLQKLKEINRLYVFHLYTTELLRLNTLLEQEDSITLEAIIDSANTLLALMEQINEFRQDELITEHKETISELENQWLKIGFSLAEKGLFDLAVDAWSKIPAQSALYTRAHFAAFECIYHAKRDSDDTAFSAFLNALPCCFDSENRFIVFAGNEQKVFTGCLLAAVGLNATNEQIDSLDQSTVNSLLKYVLLRAALDDFKANNQVKVRNTDSLFAVPRVQGLIAKLDKLLPPMPLSMDSLKSVEDLIHGINGKQGLWVEGKPGIDEAIFMDNNLKLMIKGVFKQEALDLTTNQTPGP